MDQNNNTVGQSKEELDFANKVALRADALLLTAPGMKRSEAVKQAQAEIEAERIKEELPKFWELFTRAVSDACYAAQCRLEAVEWELARCTPGTLDLAARLRGEGDPISQFESEYRRGATTERDALPFDDAIGAIDTAPEDFDTLMEFLRLNLAAARSRAFLNYWRPVRFYLEGDDQAFDMGNEWARMDFVGRFHEWLRNDAEALTKWNASGLNSDALETYLAE